MASISLSDTEFGQLMFILANAEGKGITWATVNPLMMKIGEQLRLQAQAAKMATLTGQAVNGEDVEHKEETRQ